MLSLVSNETSFSKMRNNWQPSIIFEKSNNNYNAY